MAAGRGPLPLVRALSRRLTPRLAAWNVSADQATCASMLLGLAAAAAYLDGSRAHVLSGAALLIACYVLDNCDGELARARGTASARGALLDTASDAVVHVVLFAAMGVGLTRALGDPTWAWLGLLAASGAAINSAIAIRVQLRAVHPTPSADAGGATPRGALEWLLFAFRELGRADFCFLLALATAAQLHGWLLAASAVGAHVYWITAFSRSARRFRV